MECPFSDGELLKMITETVEFPVVSKTNKAVYEQPDEMIEEVKYLFEELNMSDYAAADGFDYLVDDIKSSITETFVSPDIALNM